MNVRYYIIYAALVVMVLISVTACRKQGSDAAQIPASFYPQIATSDDPVKITGINFTTATGVSFGSTPAKSFTIVSDSVIFATVGAGASGNISISIPSGNIVMTGFTYYTPKTFQMEGPCTYYYSGASFTYGTTVYSPGSLNRTDSGTISILGLNRFDTHRNFFYITGLSSWSTSIPANPYADSANYIRLYGFYDDFGGYPSSTTGRYLRIGQTQVVYAKLVDTSLTIPSQDILVLKKNIKGSGSLVNGKLKLNYTVSSSYGNVTGALDNIKISNVVSK